MQSAVRIVGLLGALVLLFAAGVALAAPRHSWSNQTAEIATLEVTESIGALLAKNQAANCIDEDAPEGPVETQCGVTLNAMLVPPDFNSATAIKRLLLDAGGV